MFLGFWTFPKLGIKTPFSKKYRKFKKNNNGQISITGPDLENQNILLKLKKISH